MLPIFGELEETDWTDCGLESREKQGPSSGSMKYPARASAGMELVNSVSRFASVSREVPNHVNDPRAGAHPAVHPRAG